MFANVTRYSGILRIYLQILIAYVVLLGAQTNAEQETLRAKQKEPEPAEEPDTPPDTVPNDVSLDEGDPRVS